MNKKFSTAWKGSKRPGKQRKYKANAPLHIKGKFVSVNLAKPLRKTVGKRNIQIRKNDKVKIMRGKFKGKEGKVLSVRVKYGKVYVEGIQVTKMDNSKANVPLKPSNLQIIEMTERTGKRKANTEKKEVKKDSKESKIVSGTKSQDSSSKESRTKEMKK